MIRARISVPCPEGVRIRQDADEERILIAADPLASDEAERFRIALQEVTGMGISRKGGEFIVVPGVADPEAEDQEERVAAHLRVAQALQKSGFTDIAQAFAEMGKAILSGRTGREMIRHQQRESEAALARRAAERGISVQTLRRLELQERDRQARANGQTATVSAGPEPFYVVEDFRKQAAEREHQQVIAAIAPALADEIVAEPVLAMVEATSEPEAPVSKHRGADHPDQQWIQW
jgi:hypothetical protein